MKGSPPAPAGLEDTPPSELDGADVTVAPIEELVWGLVDVTPEVLVAPDVEVACRVVVVAPEVVVVVVVVAFCVVEVAPEVLVAPDVVVAFSVVVVAFCVVVVAFWVVVVALCVVVVALWVVVVFFGYVVVVPPVPPAMAVASCDALRPISAISVMRISQIAVRPRGFFACLAIVPTLCSPRWP